MSPRERSSSGESDDECLPDLQKLKPYDLEPEILSLDGILTSSMSTYTEITSCSICPVSYPLNHGLRQEFNTVQIQNQLLCCGCLLYLHWQYLAHG